MTAPRDGRDPSPCPSPDGRGDLGPDASTEPGRRDGESKSFLPLGKRRLRDRRSQGERTSRRIVSGLLVTLAVLAASCAGPPADRPPGALFEDARAVAATPDGALYVIEGATGEVLVLRAGLVVRRLGGSGTTAEATIDPVALDPTNGQAVFVADRAAGAIHHFTAEGRLAGSVPVPDVDPARPLRQAVRDGARGRPVAVAAAPDGALYVADAGRAHVLRLDAEGTVERVLGAGRLREPVALAVADDGTLWVADAGRGGLQAFDAFGTPGAFAEAALSGPLLALTVRGTVAVVAAGGGLQTLDLSAPDFVCATAGCGPLMPVPARPEPFRGVAFVGDRLAVLTATRVFVGPGRDSVVD